MQPMLVGGRCSDGRGGRGEAEALALSYADGAEGVCRLLCREWLRPTLCGAAQTAVVSRAAHGHQQLRPPHESCRPRPRRWYNVERRHAQRPHGQHRRVGGLSRLRIRTLTCHHRQRQQDVLHRCHRWQLRREPAHQQLPFRQARHQCKGRELFRPARMEHR